MNQFHKLFKFLRKRGSMDTLHILLENTSPLATDADHVMDQSDFFKELAKDSYPNTFFRVRDDLLTFGLIERKYISRNGESVQIIGLTVKGRQFCKHLIAMNKLVGGDVKLEVTDNGNGK